MTNDKGLEGYLVHWHGHDPSTGEKYPASFEETEDVPDTGFCDCTTSVFEKFEVVNL